ncbi:MAG: sulfotransferase family 2 domain-containing protein, partial [Sedimenticolaceae bacterium]
AGTSLRSLLKKQIAGEAMVILDPPLAADTKAEFTRRLPQMRALKGHLYFGVDEQLGFRGDYVTFLRDPVARVVSFWKHQQTHAHSAFHAQVKAGVTLREFVNSCQTLQTDNHMTRILVGTCAPGMLDGSMNRITDERYLQIALDNVAQRFRFVGFVEHFDDSVRALFEALGWPVEAKWGKRLNVLRSAEDALDDATLEAIRQHNALDLALYQTLLDAAPWLVTVSGSEGAL